MELSNVAPPASAGGLVKSPTIGGRSSARTAPDECRTAPHLAAFSCGITQPSVRLRTPHVAPRVDHALPGFRCLLKAALAFSLPLAVACNTTPIEYLTSDDVTNLPPGDAVGTMYDGRIYRQSSLVIESCQCMPGSVSFGLPCTGPVPIEDLLFVQVLQDDAEVSFRLLRRNANGDFEEVPPEDSPVFALAAGSLFQDGTFLVGSVLPLLNADEAEVGQTITLIEGHIFDDRLELDFTLHGTVAENGQMDDCQLSGVETFVREQ